MLYMCLFPSHTSIRFASPGHVAFAGPKGLKCAVRDRGVSPVVAAHISVRSFRCTQIVERGCSTAVCIPIDESPARAKQHRIDGIYHSLTFRTSWMMERTKTRGMSRATLRFTASIRISSGQV
jgi:hypothetical protein